MLCNAGCLDVYGVTQERLYGKTLIESLPDHSVPAQHADVYRPGFANKPPSPVPITAAARQ
ncbi:hypothetical protein [Pseudomonas sp. FW305-3-2-15-C-LB1]|uniref:hypothetical protein n=1 Tax=unclassified Pseudomonas TaxID=196821 RepID=UPI001CA55147